MYSLRNVPKHFFSDWKKNIPKHKYVLDLTSYRMAHPVWSYPEVEQVEVTHRPRKGIRDHIAYGIMRSLRVVFDFFSGYKPGEMDEERYLRRFVFLETVAGVPGMVGGMARHMRSLRTMKRD